MSEIRFEQAVFLKENRSEIEQIKEQWNRVTGKAISNTLVQLTNPELIKRIIDVGEFVYNDDITPTSLNLIKRTLEEVQEYVHGDDFVRCENTVKELAELVTRATRKSSGKS